MKSNRHTLLCTVGTSLLEGNLRNLTENTSQRPENWQAIREAYDRKAWRRVARELVNVDPTQRICGAEINTIEEIRRNQLLPIEKLVFFLSDTPAGRSTGEILHNYFEARDDLKLRAVECEVVESLQDERPEEFRVHGLRNLVRAMGEHIQKCGGPEFVAIDATGGYKAQIAIAVVLGQTLGIPVYYKFERFSTIIDFPPLPVSFDYSVLGENADVLTSLERGKVYTGTELPEIDERVKVLVTEIRVDNTTLYELSPIGQIYLTGYSIKHPRRIQFARAKERKPPHLPSHHYPKGFEEFVNRIWRENEWIRTIASTDYSGQRAIHGSGFYVHSQDGRPRLLGTFEDSTNFGARFLVLLDEESELALVDAARLLNSRYGLDQH